MKKCLLFFLLLGGLTLLPKGIIKADNLGQRSLKIWVQTIPQAMVEVILKQAASKLGVPYQDLCQDYLDKKCSIVPISPKLYKVSDGGGSIVTILMDDLL